VRSNEREVSDVARTKLSRLRSQESEFRNLEQRSGVDKVRQEPSDPFFTAVWGETKGESHHPSSIHPSIHPSHSICAVAMGAMTGQARGIPMQQQQDGKPRARLLEEAALTGESPRTTG